MQADPIRKTCRRFNESGHAHFLTFSCFRRQPFLRSERASTWMIEAIELARQRHGFDLWAYVIMPEHVHLLIYPPEDGYEISRVLSTLKQSVSKRAILFVRNEAPAFKPRMTDVRPDGKTSLRFWLRGGGYDRNLWTPKHIWEAIDYIHANPVRRGLCDVETDWRWSSARAFAASEADPIRVDVESLPDDPRRVNAVGS